MTNYATKKRGNAEVEAKIASDKEKKMKDENDRHITDPIFTRKLIDVAYSKDSVEKKCKAVANILADSGFTKEMFTASVRLKALRQVIRREIETFICNPRSEQKKD